jgi:hypothetical protein
MQAPKGSKYFPLLHLVQVPLSQFAQFRLQVTLGTCFAAGDGVAATGDIA